MIADTQMLTMWTMIVQQMMTADLITIARAAIYRQSGRGEGQRNQHRMEQSRNDDRGGAQQHFAKNNFDRGDKDHRTGRF